LGNARGLPLQYGWGSCFPVAIKSSGAIPEKGIILSDLLFGLAVVQDKAFFLSVPLFFRPVIQKTGRLKPALLGSLFCAPKKTAQTAKIHIFLTSVHPTFLNPLKILPIFAKDR